MPPKRPYLIKPEERGHRKMLAPGLVTRKFSIDLPQDLFDWCTRKGRQKVRAWLRIAMAGEEAHNTRPACMTPPRGQEE